MVVPGLESVVGLATKTASVFAGSWKDIGGAAIAFHALKTFVFGRTLKTIEYPSGELRSATIRWPTIRTLKKGIAAENAGVTEEEIHSIARWVAPHFCERVSSSKQVRYLADDSWIIWTRSRTLSIPTRLSIDKGYPIGDPLQEGLLKLVQNLFTSSEGAAQIEEAKRDKLVVMAAAKDEGLLALYRSFGHDPPQFRHFSLNYLARREAEEQERYRALKRTQAKKARGDGQPDEAEDQEEEASKQRTSKFDQNTESVVAAASADSS
mmetsp:Transcript_11729/g.20398  ORF Transcript_11729/g.20398 Transcript_11729/m.20398 type:complete len:266 (+) Transcript_11729:109-906(+)